MAFNPDTLIKTLQIWRINHFEKKKKKLHRNNMFWQWIISNLTKSPICPTLFFILYKPSW